jgi:hypothetical protein
MQIQSVGHRQVLLTSAELQCFKTVRVYQRKVLVKQLLRSDIEVVKQGFVRLGWSTNPVILAVQWLILFLAAPLLLLWLLVRFAFGLLLFPFRFLQTYLVPKDLTAPGEKTLVGIYNSFNRYMNLDAASYVACLNDWVRILYGEEVLRQYNLNDYLQKEMQRLGINDRTASNSNQYTPELRSLLGASREKLSRQLGHYLKPKTGAKPTKL